MGRVGDGPGAALPKWRVPSVMPAKAGICRGRASLSLRRNVGDKKGAAASTLSPGRPARAAPASRPAASRGGHSALTICHRQIVRARLIPRGRAHCGVTSRTGVGSGWTMKCPSLSSRRARPRSGAALRALPQWHLPRPVMPAKAGISGRETPACAGVTGRHAPPSRPGDQPGLRPPPGPPPGRRAFGADDLPPADRPGAPHPPRAGALRPRPQNDHRESGAIDCPDPASRSARPRPVAALRALQHAAPACHAREAGISGSETSACAGVTGIEPPPPSRPGA